MVWRQSRPWLRGVAILIAVAGLIDPAVTTNRVPKPTIVLLQLDADSALTDRVARLLDKDFRVIAAPFPAADATVVIGDHLPERSEQFTAPTFAVTTRGNAVSVRIEALKLPNTVMLDSRAEVHARIGVTGAKSQKLAVTLRVNELAMDRTVVDVATDDQLIDVSLAFAHSAVGTALVTVSTEIEGIGSSGATIAHAAAQVTSVPWSVLFFDAHPSWMSTFVRRSVEADSRFEVTSRVVTSRNISSDIGAPPATLESVASLERFDAIVIGAADGLTERDAAGLEDYLRQRGGSVIVLLDGPVIGPWQRLVASSAWQTYTGRAVPVMAPGDTTGLIAEELAWPTTFPEGARVLARGFVVPRDSTAARPVIWQTSIGAGRLVVGGALDSWRHRDATESDFDRFWRSLLAASAASSPPEISVTTTPAVARPGETIRLHLALRNPVLGWQGHATTAASVAARLQPTNAGAGTAADADEMIRLWPVAGVGEFEGEFLSPNQAGDYRIVVVTGDKVTATPLLVRTGTRHAIASTPELLGSWVGARGGQVLSPAEVSELPGLLARVVNPSPRPERWHPMRSGWLLALFVLLLSTEWWLIRRAGGA